ncbi:putative acyltransferase [Bradyrhizobium oligotrophicum S58]|uniref:Putative acyltransferase n=1 Tax=Bradyrhizobium oligotrophicum S58 TaxID=1245469 RepID=M4Z8L9_9BRAD|nr:GNAT family N-acetyltransferase [Bradyrhizobium oligotrophicum]BAM89541.1 putative acyltransferase [Bradyrhizobium oligotrophicum S58]
MPTLDLSAEHRAALDRPVWSALTSGHRALAEGAAHARRYPAAIAPFAAMSDDSDAAWSELADLAKKDVVAIVTPAPPVDLHGLDARFSASVRQMVAVEAVDPVGDAVIEMLDQRDIPAMLELTALTKPGPFLARTHELGRYIGIRDGQRLAAMAGERMRLDGFTEISAVCVHPDYRGRGYAQRLITDLMTAIRGRGETPFLHVIDDNHAAIALYERLGFMSRTTLCFTVLRPSDR